MAALDDFLSLFDDEGRYRPGDGSVAVVFVTNQGKKYPGRLEFKEGLCVRAAMEGGSDWSYPDGSPLSELRLHLAFGPGERLDVTVQNGRVVPRGDQRNGFDSPALEDLFEGRGGFRVTQLARTALRQLPRHDQDAVLETVSGLANRPRAEWPESVWRVGGDQPMYILPVTPELRAFLRVTEAGLVELVDVMLNVTLASYLERLGAGSAVP